MYGDDYKRCDTIENDVNTKDIQQIRLTTPEEARDTAKSVRDTRKTWNVQQGGGTF